jgi:hypothetical protein
MSLTIDDTNNTTNNNTNTTDADDFAGFADDLDDTIPDNLVDNAYLCDLDEVKKVIGADKRRWVTFKWIIVEEGNFEGEEITEMYQRFTKLNFEEADAKERNRIRKIRRNLRARLESLGVPKEKLAETNPEDLEGLQAYVTINVRPKADSNEMNVWVKNVELNTSAGDAIDLG